MSSFDLSSETKSIELILNFPRKEKELTNEYIKTFIDSLESYLKSNSKEYYFILHDRDINQKLGELKTPHIHVLYVIEKRKRLSTTLNDVSKALDISPLCIQITKWSSYTERIQYLIHKNSPEKVLYRVNEIHSSNNDLDLVLNAPSKNEITIDYLIFLVLKYDNRVELYSEIGLNLSYRYRALINELYDAKCKGLIKG